jgi:hypothetical protein
MERLGLEEEESPRLGGTVFAYPRIWKSKEMERLGYRGMVQNKF